MRQGQNPKRSRGRGNSNRRNVPARHHTFDSNGPNVRIRGNAFQVHEKYLALARDASASGDRIAAENYMQHADHYFRIINVDNDDEGQGRGRHQGHRQDGRGGNGRDFDEGHDFIREGSDVQKAEESGGRATAGGSASDSDGSDAVGDVTEAAPGLGEQPDVPEAPKRRGRPPRSADKSNGTEDSAAETTAEAPKPRRGRPRKSQVAEAQPEE